MSAYTLAASLREDERLFFPRATAAIDEDGYMFQVGSLSTFAPCSHHAVAHDATLFFRIVPSLSAPALLTPCSLPLQDFPPPSDTEPLLPPDLDYHEDEEMQTEVLSNM